MPAEQPSQEALDRFDDAVDDATHAVISHFEWIGLPEGDQRSDILIRINAALTPILRDWL